MSNTWGSVLAGSCVLLYLLIGVVLVVGFRRTRMAGLLVLLLAVVVWPVIQDGLETLRLHFLDAVLRGERPWLFPYSLMVSGVGGWTGWEMPPGAFMMMHAYVTEIVHLMLVTAGMLMLVRALVRQQKRLTGE